MKPSLTGRSPLARHCQSVSVQRLVARHLQPVLLQLCLLLHLQHAKEADDAWSKWVQTQQRSTNWNCIRCVYVCVWLKYLLWDPVKGMRIVTRVLSLKGP